MKKIAKVLSVVLAIAMIATLFAAWCFLLHKPDLQNDETMIDAKLDLKKNQTVLGYPELLPYR